MRVWELRELGNYAEHLREAFSGRKGSYSVGEDEAIMVIKICRFVLSMDDLHVQLKGEEEYNDPRLVIGA